MDELYTQLYHEYEYACKMANKVNEEDREMKCYYEGRAEALELALNLVKIYDN